MTREPYEDKLDATEQRRLELLRDRAKARASVARWTALVVIASLSTLLWLFRWDVTPTTGESGFPSAVVLDRLTGNLYYVRQNFIVPIGQRR